MVQEEKLRKICEDFNLLNEGQQDYILGILQALVFANNIDKKPVHEGHEKSILVPTGY